MRVLDNILEIVTGVWEDPGEYPSAAGFGPLPSRLFVEEITGEVTAELEPGDLDED